MMLTTPDPHVYTRPASWHACTGCGAMWTGFDDEPCWACGGQGLPSRSPALTSRSGFAPPDFDDPRP